jgi:hypothetical protein
VHVVARTQLLASWTSALDAAGAAVRSASDIKALDTAGRSQREQRLRAEREWLRGFELESGRWFP